MPAGINEAYMSPFNRMKPSSQLYDMNSFTRDSIKSEFNQNYQLNIKLPEYTPSMKYPTLHPTGDYQSDQDSIVKDPHQGAGWIQPSREEPSEVSCGCRSSGSLNPPQKASSSIHDDCDELINRVLTNRYCRRILKKLLIDADDPELHELPEFNKIIESSIDPETIKNIVVYGLLGLLILCILNLVFKIGQLVTIPR